MGCGTTTAKYLVFIFNFLFFLAGVALIVIGALALSHKVDYQDVVKEIPNIKTVSILFIVVGAVVTVIAFFGCCGAVQESTCMLNTFSTFLVLIILAEIAIAIAALVLRSQIQDAVRTGMNSTLVSYLPVGQAQTSDVNSTSRAWDDMQEGWDCCGINGPSDWQANTFYGSTGNLPISCCNGTVTTCTTSTSPFTTGCGNKMDKALNIMYIVIGVIGIVVGLIEITGIAMACCLSKAVRYKLTETI